MNPDASRSEEVVAEFKKHKLAISALRKIQTIIHGFEKDRKIDTRLALVGLLLILIMVAISAYYMLASNSVTIT